MYKNFTIVLGSFMICWGLFSCGSKKEGLTGPEQRKRVEDFRKNREQQIAIDGFWQEYSRTEIKKRMAESALPFTDTLKVRVRADSLTRFYDMQGRVSAGQLTFKGNVYHLGNGQTFKTMERRGDTLRLGNGESFSYLRKVRGFYTKPVGPVRIDENGKELTINLNSDNLIGKWTTYKKEDGNFNAKNYYLRKIEIVEHEDNGNYRVKVSMASMSDALATNATMTASKKSMEISLPDNQDLKYEIMKLDESEMILRRGTATLYFKNFDR